MGSFAVILPAAGRSSRFGDSSLGGSGIKKPFCMIGSQAIWRHAASPFANHAEVKQILLVLASEDIDYFHEKFGASAAFLGAEIVIGGDDRTQSVRNALAKVKPEIEFVAIHDAARPCVNEAMIDRVFKACVSTGAAILATPVTATLKRATGANLIQETVLRDSLWEAQTPQCFRKDWLLEAYAKFGDKSATDDAQILERAGRAVTLVNGSSQNLKITTKEDIRLASAILNESNNKRSVSAHPFAEDRLWK